MGSMRHLFDQAISSKSDKWLQWYPTHISASSGSHRNIHSSFPPIHKRIHNVRFSSHLLATTLHTAVVYRNGSDPTRSSRSKVAPDLQIQQIDGKISSIVGDSFLCITAILSTTGCCIRKWQRFNHRISIQSCSKPPNTTSPPRDLFAHRWFFFVL